MCSRKKENRQKISETPKTLQTCSLCITHSGIGHIYSSFTQNIKLNPGPRHSPWVIWYWAAACHSEIINNFLHIKYLSDSHTKRTQLAFVCVSSVPPFHFLPITNKPAGVYLQASLLRNKQNVNNNYCLTTCAGCHRVKGFSEEAFTNVNGPAPCQLRNELFFIENVFIS